MWWMWLGCVDPVPPAVQPPTYAPPTGDTGGPPVCADEVQPEAPPVLGPGAQVSGIAQTGFPDDYLIEAPLRRVVEVFVAAPPGVEARLDGEVISNGVPRAVIGPLVGGAELHPLQIEAVSDDACEPYTVSVAPLEVLCGEDEETATGLGNDDPANTGWLEDYPNHKSVDALDVDHYRLHVEAGYVATVSIGGQVTVRAEGQTVTGPGSLVLPSQVTPRTVALTVEPEALLSVCQDYSLGVRAQVDTCGDINEAPVLLGDAQTGLAQPESPSGTVGHDGDRYRFFMQPGVAEVTLVGGVGAVIMDVAGNILHRLTPANENVTMQFTQVATGLRQIDVVVYGVGCQSYTLTIQPNPGSTSVPDCGVDADPLTVQQDSVQIVGTAEGTVATVALGQNQGVQVVNPSDDAVWGDGVSATFPTYTAVDALIELHYPITCNPVADTLTILELPCVLDDEVQSSVAASLPVRAYVEPGQVESIDFTVPAGGVGRLQLDARALTGAADVDLGVWWRGVKYGNAWRLPLHGRNDASSMGVADLDLQNALGTECVQVDAALLLQ